MDIAISRKPQDGRFNVKMKNRDINIITVEDPVEYRINNINQVQLNTEAGMTFAGGLTGRPKRCSGTGAWDRRPTATWCTAGGASTA
jgi:type II secretory ATPase GspE/PulE/Tfp pilus assembly ATPase PilB-like protein